MSNETKDISPDYTLPRFPTPGSILAGRYFCLGRLGRGTFCSIHKCIDLSYSSTPTSSVDSSGKRCNRLVAAKVELGQFSNSGVVDGEATILNHLDKVLGDDVVPHYHEYVKFDVDPESSQGTEGNNSSCMSTIVMEFLPGEDMHQLRERHCAKTNQKSISSSKCRVNLADAVYLTADCMLPLLKKMHDAGVIHRDVKPNNCVRSGTTEKDKKFKIVDFGLSKSFVVPVTSSVANKETPWKDRPWSNPEKDKLVEGCIRKERTTADFRGTSMYASLRVHQSKDYGRRDDIWGLLYVFCDLVSGGLPWMKQAGERDRDMCEKMKERVHGESNPDQKDEIEDLLKGAAHHMSKQRKAENTSNSEIIPPLKLSEDKGRVELLRKAFKHVASLQFHDEPDYKLIEECLRGFTTLEKSEELLKEDEMIAEIDWNIPSSRNKRRKIMDGESNPPEELVVVAIDSLKKFGPRNKAVEEEEKDAISPMFLEEAELEKESQNSADQSAGSASVDSSDTGKLHIALQMRLAQAEYNARNSQRIPPDVALGDWLALAIHLVCEDWDVSKYERGNHRKNDDSYRREIYVKMLNRCLAVAKPFRNFTHKKYFVNSFEKFQLSNISIMFSTIRLILAKEGEKQFAPPPAISFF